LPVRLEGRDRGIYRIMPARACAAERLFKITLVPSAKQGLKIPRSLKYEHRDTSNPTVQSLGLSNESFKVQSQGVSSEDAS